MAVVRILRGLKKEEYEKKSSNNLARYAELIERQGRATGVYTHTPRRGVYVISRGASAVQSLITGRMKVF